MPLFKLVLRVVGALISCIRISTSQEGVITAVKLIHTVVFITLQEFLRVSAFMVLGLHLYGPSSPRAYSTDFHPVNDPSFLEAWLLGLGWAVAEVCASIAQGYDLLATYEDLFLASSHCGHPNDVESVGRIDFMHHVSNPSRDDDDDESLADAGEFDALVMNGNGAGLKGVGHANGDFDDAVLDLEVALTRLVNAKARDDLEAVYGVPFIVSYSYSQILRRY